MKGWWLVLYTVKPHLSAHSSGFNKSSKELKVLDVVDRIYYLVEKMQQQMGMRSVKYDIGEIKNAGMKH